MPEIQRVAFLKGKKTVLRPVSEADLPIIIRWINDEEVRGFLNAYLPQNEQDEREWLARLSKDKSHHITLLIETTDSQPIGVMSLGGINWRDRLATTGAFIGEKEFWGKGYGSDAKMALLNYAFNTLNLRKVCATVLAFNERSRRYQLKCGYKQEGVLREHIFRNGKYWDLLQFAVFREDFEPVWKKYSESV